MGVDTESVCSGGGILAAIERAGMTVTETARAMGVPRNRLSEALHGRRCFAAEHLERLPVAVLAPIVARLAERCGFGLVDLPTADVVTSSARALARVAKESADVVSVYAESLADGHMCAAEGARIDAECEQAIRAFRAVQLQARSAVRERVIGVAV